MRTEYFSVLVFLLIGLVMGVLPLVLGFLLGPRKPDPEKNSPYECGFSPFESARLPFDVRYYLVAILFILFDLETAFVIPWAVAFRQLGIGSVLLMLFFLGMLTIGFIYEWKRGALKWQ